MRVALDILQLHQRVEQAVRRSERQSAHTRQIRDSEKIVGAPKQFQQSECSFDRQYASNNKSISDKYFSAMCKLNAACGRASIGFSAYWKRIYAMAMVALAAL